MDSENTVVDFPTDQEQIASIIEDSFPKKNSDKDLGNPQSDANRLGSRIFFLWVWPIVAVNKFRNLFSRMDFVKPYDCLLYTSPSPRDRQKSRMPSSA